MAIMMGAIKVGKRYLVEVDVESGYAGHSAVLRLPDKGITTADEPYYFSSNSIGNKVKSVIELMKWEEIKRENIEIIIEG